SRSVCAQVLKSLPSSQAANAAAMIGSKTGIWALSRLRESPRTPFYMTQDFLSGRLRARTILITGGSRGIGLAIAEACGREGAILGLAARESPALRDAARRVPGSTAFPADLTNEDDVRALFRSFQQRFKRLDVLVNSAGVFTYKPFMKINRTEWDRNLATNLTALYSVTRGALPLLKRGSAPQIVNMLSISSRTAFPNCAAYCASKFGALGFTRVIAQELRPLGIRVTAILPGSTSTRMSGEFDFPVDRAKLLQPEDVAQAVLTALLQPCRGVVDEIFLTPAAGNLSARSGSKEHAPAGAARSRKAHHRQSADLRSGPRVRSIGHESNGGDKR
ncbi:MAG: SDR family oxidoreductase, partial [Terriglobia bacterium]